MPSRSFRFLKATITDRDDNKSEFNGTVEEYWVSPMKWRRVIKLRDFSQTRIVNGDAVYEDNNGDYFPLHDEMLANEIVDPLPKSAVELIKKLDLAGPEPGSGEGQCMAEKYFNDAEGKETRGPAGLACVGHVEEVGLFLTVRYVHSTVKWPRKKNGPCLHREK